MDTIFALSSGAPPAGIGVIRVSGPRASDALRTLAGRLPSPRHASFARLHDADGVHLDDGLILWFPGPGTATGEDLAELHCHGGRAVIAAIERALGEISGLRQAQPGEFTRRAFANSVIDLAEAEGLGDLLSAETELQRSAALALAGGALGKVIDDWTAQLLRLSAQVEAVLDFSDEDDVSAMPAGFVDDLEKLIVAISDWLKRPQAELLGTGFRVALAGPPNAGKSTLFNALVDSEAAITSSIAGTTRDVITRSVAIDGVPFTFVDMAGLRDLSAGEGEGDPIEAIGIQRAMDEIDAANAVLWLGEERQAPISAVWEVAAKADAPDFVAKTSADAVSVSAATGDGIDQLKRELVRKAREQMPQPGEVALNRRHRTLLREALVYLVTAQDTADPLILGEQLRVVRSAFDRITGRVSVEDMLDTLFGRFCIGK